MTKDEQWKLTADAKAKAKAKEEKDVKGNGEKKPKRKARAKGKAKAKATAKARAKALAKAKAKSKAAATLKGKGKPRPRLRHGPWPPARTLLSALMISCSLYLLVCQKLWAFHVHHHRLPSCLRLLALCPPMLRMRMRSLP